MKQKPQGIPCVFAGIFVIYDGKDAQPLGDKDGNRSLGGVALNLMVNGEIKRAGVLCFYRKPEEIIMYFIQASIIFF